MRYVRRFLRLVTEGELDPESRREASYVGLWLIVLLLAAFACILSLDASFSEKAREFPSLFFPHMVPRYSRLLESRSVASVSSGARIVPRLLRGRHVHYPDPRHVDCAWQSQRSSSQ